MASITIPDSNFLSKFTLKTKNTKKVNSEKKTKPTQFKAKEIPPSTFLNLFEQIKIKETINAEKKQQKSKFSNL